MAFDSTPPSSSPRRMNTGLVATVVIIAVALVVAGVAYAFGWPPFGSMRTDEPSMTAEPTQTAIDPVPVMAPWTKTLCGAGNDRFTDVAVGPDGVIVAVGQTYSNDSDYADVEGYSPDYASGVVAHFAPDGELLSLDITPGRHYDAVDIGPDGTIVVVGGTNTGAMRSQPFMMKLAADGSVLWTVDKVDESQLNGAYTGVSISEWGNISVTGYYMGDYPVEGEAFVAQVDASGEPRWFKPAHSLDRYDDVATLPTGDVVVVGSSYGTREMRDAPNTAMALRVTSDGTPVWYQVYSDNGVTLFSSHFSSVAVAHNGVVVAGDSNDSREGGYANDDGDALIGFIHGSGELEWIENKGGQGTTSFTGVTFFANSWIVAVGETDSPGGDFPSPNAGNEQRDGFVAQFPLEGAVDRVEVFGGSAWDSLSRVVSTPSGIIAVGLTSSRDGNLPATCGDYDALIMYIALA